MFVLAGGRLLPSCYKFRQKFTANYHFRLGESQPSYQHCSARKRNSGYQHWPSAPRSKMHLGWAMASSVSVYGMVTMSFAVASTCPVDSACPCAVSHHHPRIIITPYDPRTISPSAGPASLHLSSQVAKSLNIIWLLSANSLEDSSCLMEVCAAIRQGTPVFPICLEGPSIRSLKLPIWSSGAAQGEVASGRLSLGSEGDITGNVRKGKDHMRGRCHQLDLFYKRLSHVLPKATQEELHRNRFLVRDAISAVRACFESMRFNDATEPGEASPENSESSQGELKLGKSALPLSRPPPTFDISTPSSSRALLEDLLGVLRDSSGSVKWRRWAAWNWQRLPNNNENTSRSRNKGVIPWRTDEEIADLIGLEEADTGELARECEGRCEILIQRQRSRANTIYDSQDNRAPASIAPLPKGTVIQ